MKRIKVINTPIMQEFQLRSGHWIGSNFCGIYTTLLPFQKGIKHTPSSSFRKALKEEIVEYKENITLIINL